MGVKSLLSFAILSAAVKLGAGVRCYECSSIELPDCGDPFFSSRVPAVECDNLFTQTTFMCFKVSHYAAGQYITVRGCAPFSTETFPRSLQRGMAGTYWKYGNGMSLCDYNNCNSAGQLKISLAILLPLLLLLLTGKQF